MNRIRIRNGRVLDPAAGIDRVTDLYIHDGRIAALDTLDGFQPDRTIDAGGCLVIPGLVDLCARLREPGEEHKATIASELKAAAAGGVTTLCVPPDTVPVIDTPAVVDMIQRRSRQLGLATVHTYGALTRSLEGEILAEMDALKAAGCIGVSNALAPIISTEVLRRAFEYAASCDLKVFLYAEDSHLRGRGVANEGPISTRLGLPGIPEMAETVALCRALLLAEQTGVSIHFCRITTARGVDLLAAARDRGLPVSADVGIAWLHLTDDSLLDQDANCHLLPPLRDAAHRDALRRGIASGAIDAICSDHQPHDEDAKAGPFVATRPGAATLDEFLALTLALGETAQLDLADRIATVTSRPAGVLGLAAGTLQTGRVADVCIVDPDASWTVDPDRRLSAGRNSPFNGRTLKGRVRYTIRRGKFSYDPETTP